jgi:HAE1 family hydrophobic/amphiphilic exporter-1
MNANEVIWIGLVPLVMATGVGGMLLGTQIGVFLIPGLYVVFAGISDGKKLLRDEAEEPLTETIEHATPTEVHHDA